MLVQFTQSVALHFSWVDITSPTEVQNMGEEMECLDQGLYVLRINLPYFQWYKALKVTPVTCHLKANMHASGFMVYVGRGGNSEVEAPIHSDVRPFRYLKK